MRCLLTEGLICSQQQPREFSRLYTAQGGWKPMTYCWIGFNFRVSWNYPFVLFGARKRLKRGWRKTIFTSLPAPRRPFGLFDTLVITVILKQFFSLLFQAKNPTNALGRAANGVSPEAMSSLGTIANIPAPNRSNVVIATDASADPITWPCTWNVTHPGDLFKIRTV